MGTQTGQAAAPVAHETALHCLLVPAPGGRGLVAGSTTCN
jgi:ribosomal protein S5